MSDSIRETGPKTCYRFFAVYIIVNKTAFPGEKPGWEVDHVSIFDAGSALGMGGNIHKSCRCLSESEMKQIKRYMGFVGLGSGGITSEPRRGGTVYKGVEIEELYTPCDYYAQCKCNKNIELGGMSNKDDYWTDSAGMAHQLTQYNSYDDLMQDIINTERLLPCICS